MATISTLKDSKTEEICYPQTMIDAVYDSDGSTLRDKLGTAITEATIQSIVDGSYASTTES